MTIDCMTCVVLLMNGSVPHPVEGGKTRIWSPMASEVIDSTLPDAVTARTWSVGELVSMAAEKASTNRSPLAMPFVIAGRVWESQNSGCDSASATPAGRAAGDPKTPASGRVLPGRLMPMPLAAESFRRR